MLGINCVELTLLQPADQKRVLSDIAAFGFRHVRFGVSMKLVCPSKGAYVWDAVVTARDLARANGIELLPLLPIDSLNMPSWAMPADFAAFSARAAALLAAPAYEIGNEPNLQTFNAFGNPAPIVPLIQKAWSGIKGAQPAAKVVFPGLAACETFVARFLWWSLYGNLSPEDFLTGALKLGVGAFFDVMAYHPYSIDGQFAQQPPSATQVMIAKTPGLAKMAGRPLWATEWGFPSNTLTLTECARRFTAQLPLMNVMCERSYFFAWRDDPRHGGNLGIVDANNAPKQPLYGAVKAALAQ